MKVGILTVHRAINLGAVLQCYALQQMLRSEGHDVRVINYVQEKVERTDRHQSGLADWLHLLLGFHLRSVLTYIPDAKFWKKVYAMYDGFIDKYLDCTALCSKDDIPQNFNAYVIGSDQLWNSNIFGYSEPVFWGNFKHPENSRLVAYAPSTSVDNLKAQSHDFIQRSLDNFSSVSLREKSATDYINDNFALPRKAVTVLDPTLAVDRKVWLDMPEVGDYSKKDYIVVYEARSYTKNPKMMAEKAKDLAGQLGCDIISVSPHRHSPKQFLSIMRNARYVISSSFHGIVFSLIFNRPLFAVKYGEEQDSRYVNLLKSVGAESMLVDADFKPKPFTFDYKIVNEKLDALRKQSQHYLYNSLAV